jgi:hypothetical protein
MTVHEVKTTVPDTFAALDLFAVRRQAELSSAMGICSCAGMKHSEINL